MGWPGRSFGSVSAADSSATGHARWSGNERIGVEHHRPRNTPDCRDWRAGCNSTYGRSSARRIGQIRRLSEGAHLRAELKILSKKAGSYVDWFFICHEMRRNVMKSHRIAVAPCVIAMLTVVDVVWTDEHVRFPGDVPVDIYHSGRPTGTLHDGEWVVIPFWRLPESIPLDFNLLDTFDSRAVDLPLLVEGSARFRDNLPMS